LTTITIEKSKEKVPKRILIAEDHTILREGLRSILSRYAEFEVVGEAKDGREAIRMVRQTLPDLVMIDLSMPQMDGREAIREIKRLFSKTKILVLTVHKTEEYILETLKAGADGYLSKDSSHLELVSAIRNLFEGKKYLGPEISDKVIEGYLEGKKSRRALSTWETITAREREIIKLIAEGYKSKEIAALLFLSVKTVEKHRSNLMKKLGLHSISALTSLALEKGLITK
jgi:DNA-binding NarL/FixJ family response regulator